MYKDDYKEKNKYYSRLGYRNMCRFWTKSVFEQPFMQGVTRYLRLDTDTFLERMPRDPFDALEREGLAYFGSAVYKDSAFQTQGLWETFLRFALQNGVHPAGLEPLSVRRPADARAERDLRALPAHEAADILLIRGYNLDYYYNNWEVSRVDVWKSGVYARLAEFIDASGGTFMRRWGDAPVRTLALHLLREEFAEVTGESPAVFRQYPGLVYFHKARHATAAEFAEKRPVQQYVYDRAICTGLGDRAGILMSLATLARMHYVKIAFEWCSDPSQVFSRLRQHIPRWDGYNLSAEEFVQRFWPHSSLVSVEFPQLPPQLKRLENKIKWKGLAVEAEAGLDHAYTTAWRSMEIPGRPVLEGENYKQNYRWVARAVVLHAMKSNWRAAATAQGGRYAVLHMRGGDHNTHAAFVGVHDLPKLYCTRRVLKSLFKALPDARVFLVSNNVTWARGVLQDDRVEDVHDHSIYDDFALLLGASAIVQHAQHGWSAFSSNPAMMAAVPLIATYKRHLQHHRHGWLANYGGVPDEFYDCTQIGAFVSAAAEKINEKLID